MAQSTTIRFDDDSYPLPPGSDLANLMERIEAAARSDAAAAFVTFATAGSLVSVLIGSRTRVTVCVDQPIGASAAMGSLPDDWADWKL